MGLFDVGVLYRGQWVCAVSQAGFEGAPKRPWDVSPRSGALADALSGEL